MQEHDDIVKNQFTNIYATHATLYIEKGLWPFPVTPNTKAVKVVGWTQAVLDSNYFHRLIHQYPSYGIALAMGSPIPDKPEYVLGCIDIDDDHYVPIIKAMLKNPPCAKRGRKGITYFVQVAKGLRNKEFYGGEEFSDKGRKKVIEFFVKGKVTVIPPSIHPDTQIPYEWVGTPILDMDLTQLPIIEEIL